VLQRLAERRAAVTSAPRAAPLGIAGALDAPGAIDRPDRIRVASPTRWGWRSRSEPATRLWAYQPAERVRYEGVATPQNLVRLLGAPIALAVDILGLRRRGRRRTASVTVMPDGQLSQGGEQRICSRPGCSTWCAEEARPDGVFLRVSFADHRRLPRVLDRVAESPGPCGSNTTTSTQSRVAAALFAATGRARPVEAAGTPRPG
jgi:hypothetical protein